ncbi:MAG TPA: DUF6169 family protein [Bacteroidia bacterium]
MKHIPQTYRIEKYLGDDDVFITDLGSTITLTLTRVNETYETDRVDSLKDFDFYQFDLRSCGNEFKAFDEKIANTVSFYIKSFFLSKPDAVILFLTDTTDGYGEVRYRKFRIWHSKYQRSHYFNTVSLHFEPIIFKFTNDSNMYGAFIVRENSQIVEDLREYKLLLAEEFIQIKS